MPKSVGRAIEKRLRKLGVKLYLGKAVQGETADELTVAGKTDPQPIPSGRSIGQQSILSRMAFVSSPHRKVVVDEFCEPNMTYL